MDQKQFLEQLLSKYTVRGYRGTNILEGFSDPHETPSWVVTTQIGSCQVIWVESKDNLEDSRVWIGPLPGGRFTKLDPADDTFDEEIIVNCYRTNVRTKRVKAIAQGRLYLANAISELTFEEE